MTLRPAPLAIVAVTTLACLGAGCGVSLMKLPEGHGSPISEQDGRASLAAATSACGRIHALTAEIAVSGSAGGHRLRGRLLAGVAMPDSARLEAAAPFGQPLFILAAAGGKSTLLLPRDKRVLADAPPGEVLDAVAGVPLNPSDLYTTLTGCPPAYSSIDGVAYGDDWRVLKGAGGGWRTAYLRRENPSRPWRIVALLQDDVGWRVEYLEYQNNLPRSIHLTNSGSRSSGSSSFNIKLTLSQVEASAALDPETFTIRVPADAEPISLEELRRSSPLAP
jgi:hypothetical protein